MYFYTDAPSLHFHRRWDVTVGVAAEMLAREMAGPVAREVAAVVAVMVAAVVAVVASAAAVALVTARTSSKWTVP